MMVHAEKQGRREGVGHPLAQRERCWIAFITGVLQSQYVALHDVTPNQIKVPLHEIQCVLMAVILYGQSGYPIVLLLYTLYRF